MWDKIGLWRGDRKQFIGIEYILRIKCGFDVFHGRKLIGRMHKIHTFALIDPDSMLAGDGSTHTYRFQHDEPSCFTNSTHFLLIICIHNENLGMQVAVSGMGDVTYPHTAIITDFCHTPECFPSHGKKEAASRAKAPAVIFRANHIAILSSSSCVLRKAKALNCFITLVMRSICGCKPAK